MNDTKTKRERYIPIGVLIAVLAAWYFVTKFQIVSAVMIPSPKAVIIAGLDIIRNGYKGYTLLQHLLASLERLVIAFLLVLLTAIPLGLLSGYNSTIRAFVEPIVEFYRPLPPLAYYTLLVLWMGIGNSSKIALLYLAGFAPVYIACVSGVLRIKEDYIYGAQTLGANSRQIFLYVVFPATLSDIFTGVRTAIGVEYTTLVAAEMVAAVSGIGWLVLDASNYLRSDIIFFGVILMGITGILLDQIVRFVERKVVHWKGKT
jgi:taurine transport system permease protein